MKNLPFKKENTRRCLTRWTFTIKSCPRVRPLVEPGRGLLYEALGNRNHGCHNEFRHVIYYGTIPLLGKQFRQQHESFNVQT